MFAQSQTSTSTQESVVPQLVNFSGVATDVNGKPLSGMVGITFFLYQEQQGGAPLWIETQNVSLSTGGRYTVTLGATKSGGVPVEMFASGEARWVGVQVQGQAEQPRVLLLSVPYALKAVDAQTLGGLPASAFVLAAPPVSSGSTATNSTPATGTTVAQGGTSGAQPQTACSSLTSDGKATANSVTKFTTACNLEASAITETSGRVGIGGSYTYGKLYLTDTETNFGTRWLQRGVFPTSATANGSNYGLGFDVDMSNTTIPAGITDSGYRLAILGRGYANTANFAGTLATQYGVLGESGIYTAKSGAKVTSAFGGYFAVFNNVAGTTISNAYGVYISNAGTAGTITNRYDLYAASANAKSYFAGQVGVGTTNPGTNKLEVNGTTQFDGLVTFAAGQTFPGAGGIAGVTAGTDLTGGGTSGSVTLNLDTTKVPQLAAANAFTGNVTVTATGTTLSASGGSTGLSGTGSTYGVYGSGTGTGTGVYASGSTAVSALGTNYGVYGAAYNGPGVTGSTESSSSYGVEGTNANGVGVYGSGGSYGVFGTTSSGTAAGVYGTGSSYGVSGNSGGGTGSAGVYGEDNTALSSGVWGYSDYGYGVYGYTSTGYGGYFNASDARGYAGYFQGNVDVKGTLSKTSGSFKIDHPLDPANKYLYHSFVESPDMMNIYNGNVVLDDNGTAWITLPDYFEALNRDFRYQLTAVGVPGPNLYVAQEIANNRFQIAGGKPGGKVSWQVTGIRHDAFANAHPIIPEVEKKGDERGKYLYPVEHGRPKSMGIDESRLAARKQLKKISNEQPKTQPR